MLHMNAKYVYAENYDVAVALAENYFGCGREAITIETAGDGGDTDYCMLLAMVGTPGEIPNMDAHYRLYYEKDGV